MSKLALSAAVPGAVRSEWRYFDITALAPLGERGNRKAVGEGVCTKRETMCQNRKSKSKGHGQKENALRPNICARKSRNCGMGREDQDEMWRCVLDPSPVPPRLEKAPVAGQPLPQGSEGGKFKSPLCSRGGEQFHNSRRRSRRPRIPGRWA